jgi:pSer/pThr/pTyr-binding forkhead associated (FHA) protein
VAHTYFVWKQPNQPDRVLIWDVNTISIGRSPENDLNLEDDEVSRRHAVFARGRTGGLQVMDFRTSNGTFVNGERVKQERMIEPGDTIKIGSHEFQLRTGDKHPASLGMKAQYGSQLKSVGALPKNMDAGATMLGLASTAPPDGDMVVEPERGAGGQAFVVGASDQDAYQMREIGDGLDAMELDIDDSLDGGGFGGDLDQGFDLEADEKPEPPRAVAKPAARPAPASPAPARPASPAPPTARPQPAAKPTAPKAAPAAAPGTTSPGEDPMARMRKLKILHEEGLITDEEFQTKRAQILSEM